MQVTGTYRTQLRIGTPMAPPTWALLERELLAANNRACREFFDYYFDERGYLRCVERWGGDDGPDDAIENLYDWPVLHALGGDDSIRAMAQLGWEGHLRQYTEAKTTEVPFAVDGMYYKEFPTICDWLHNGESMSVFNLMGLSDPHAPLFEKRVRRYAGLYMGEDPGAPNYDPERKIIRSMFNGSRGPMLRKATAVDWAGDPIEVENRFVLLHGERNYQEMLDHFKDYNDVAGDHPLNLGATSLVLNAYTLTGEQKYLDWLVDYTEAWLERMAANGGIIPSNIGLDGSIGGECDGKWYGGVYGWGFTVVVPQTGELAHRNLTHWGYRGFGNAVLATGNMRYAEQWGQMIDLINAQAKEVDGQTMTPRMYGDEGWYAFEPAPYAHGALDVYYWTMAERDRARVQGDPWVRFLQGDNPSFPEEVLRRDFETIRRKVAEGIHQENLTPDTRLSDNPNPYNPATVGNLFRLMLGGLPTGNAAFPLQARVRYFDPVQRRPGLPADVAALVERMTADETVVHLVNLNQTEARSVIIQGGGYGEHQIQEARIGEVAAPVNGAWCAVRLAPGCGDRVTLRMARYANAPTMLLPWD
ncbi:MAG: hypothetical protein DCC57_16585 [Chloroflexi bacterium]|nr:MAG: hypothetical protein DCC57_16585 [Chloroflexota bacterium]